VANKTYPPEVRELAYILHTRGFSRAEIQVQVHDYCRQKLKYPGPRGRTLEQWRVVEDWEAQDELMKAEVSSRLRAKVVDEKLASLEQYNQLKILLYQQIRDQAAEGVRPSPGQAIYALIEVERERQRLLGDQAKGVDIRMILESAMEPFVDILKQVLGKAFTDNQDVIFSMLEKRLIALNRKK